MAKKPAKARATPVTVQYVRSVRSPACLAGEPGQERELSARAARQLIAGGYARIVEPKKPNGKAPSDG